MTVDSEFKPHYFDHLKTMNPGGTNEATYRSCVGYYKSELLPILPADRNVRLLDVGCGFGHLVRFLLEHGYGRVGGVEIDAQLHRASSEYVGKQAEFLVCDDVLLFLKNQEDSFDVIIALDFIEHFTAADALEVTRLIYRALRNGGRAIFRTPNMANVLGIYSRYLDITHQTGFTEYSLSQLLRQAGFAETNLHLPEWDQASPLWRRLRLSVRLHRWLFSLQDRVTPKCFEKNVVMWGTKVPAP